MTLARVVRLPLLSIEAITVAPYLNTRLPPDSSIVKLVVANFATVPFTFPVPPLAAGRVPVTLVVRFAN